MFRKYFMHELRNSYTLPLFVCILSILSSGLTGLSIALENEKLLAFSSTVMGICFLACICVAFQSISKSFTSRLFSRTGYLTLTLPISTHTIIITKILLNVIYVFFMCFSIAISCFLLVFSFISTSGVDISEAIGQLYNSFVDSFTENPLVYITTSLVSLLGFISFLVTLMFILSFANSGVFAKYKRVLTIICIVAGLLVLSQIYDIKIIPFALAYDFTNKNYLLYNVSTDIGELYMNHYIFEFLDFSTLFWYIASIVGFYIGSYYIIRNKLDIE